MIHTRGESFDAREGAAAIAVEPGSAVVTVPDTHFLCTADFKRKGSDLVLTGEDGRKILVPDYFRQEKQPDLVSPEGAILSANVVELLAGPATPGQYAQAGAPAAPQPIGRVETAAGSATVVRNGVAIEVNVGDLVFQGDVVQTLSNSALAIAFSDGSAFTLNENARMALNEFVYDPNGTANSALINLVQGTVSFIAAQVAKTGTMRVETPTAVLGIRGTFITLSVSSVDGHTVASLGMESHPVTGDQFAGAFTLTDRITGNQVLVSQVNSIFSVSPGGTTSESPKPAEIHALEQATFQALVPVLQSAANLGVQTGLNQGTNQNLNQNPNQNPAQDGQQGQKSDSSPGPSPGGSSGANPADNQPPADTKPTTVPLTPAGPETQPPPATPAQTPVPTNTLPVTTPQTPTQTPTQTQTQTHITPTGSVTDVAKTEAPGAQFESFNIFERVSIADAGSATGFVIGSAVLVSATYTSGLPSTFTNAAFLSSLLTVDAAGTVSYDLGKFNFLSAGHWLSYTIAFDVASGTDTLHLTLTFTVNGANEAPHITVAAGDAASATITDDVHATTLAAGGTLSFKDADSADGHSVSVAVKSGPAIGSFAAGVIADTTGSDPANVAGDILWAFAANKAHAQSLAAGESETEVFTVTLHDGQGGSTSQDVAVTVAGVNDAPVVTSADPHIQLTETTTTGSSAAQSFSRSLTFTDPDLNDVGYTVSLLGVSASGVIAGLPDAATLLTLLHPTGVTKAAGSSEGLISATFSASEQAFDYLWAGETVTLTYTVQIADGHGGTSTQTVTVTATGTNDGPVISGLLTGSVQEDAGVGSRASGQLTVTDPDLSDTHTWTVVGGSTPHAPNYQFKIDEFKIIKNGGLIFGDTFGDGNPPPSVPSGFGNISSYSVTGTISEQNGKAVLTGSNAGFGTGSPAGDPFFGEYATLNTNTDPANTTLGLKSNSSFTLSGLFDLTLPAEDRNEYGIRLTDRTSSQAGDSTVELRVVRDAGGIVRVQLREIDLGSQTNTKVLQSFNLNPGTHDQILLTLTHDVIDGQVVHASFQLGTTDESGIHLDAATNFNPEIPATIFSGENWTRAQFFAEAPAESDSVLQGTYGQLDITQDGAWTYQLANGQTNVQALAAGQTAQDFFTAQVADGHGGFDTKTITVNITGTNDQTVLTSVNSSAVSTTVAESSGNSSTQDIAAISGSLAFSDKDIGDSLTASAASPTVLINGNALTSELSAPAAAALTTALNHLSLGAGVASNGGGTQNISWTWDPSAANLDFLKAGDTLTVTYAVHVGDSANQNLTFTVTGTNDAPVAVADAASITEDALPNTVNGNVLTNDTDVDVGDNNHVVSAVTKGETSGIDNGTTITAVGTYGTLVVTKAVGAYTYTLANGQANVQALAQGQQVTDVFTYTNSNGGLTSSSTLTVTVTGVNDAPTIAAGTTATGHMVADTQGAGAPLTELAASYLTAGHNLINGLGGSSGFGETDLAQGDDNSSGRIDITSVFGATGLNFFGQHYTGLYINNNGNLTFDSASGVFTPSVITAGANNPIIAPFWVDVDTRGGAASATPGGNSTGANLVHYDLDTVNGVVTVTWDDVGYYNSQTNRLNAFQVQLINVGNGDFDIVFRYEDINWTTGSASGGANGLSGPSGHPARAGYSAGDDNSAHYFELPQSGNETQILALESTAGNTGIAGVDAFEVRGGNVIPSLTASGTVQFADVDLADSHSVAVTLASAVRSGEGAVPAATQSDLLHALTTSMTAPDGHDSTGTGSGVLGWTFALSNADATFLAADETLTVIYNVTISDGHGGSVTQPVTLIITGAEHRTDWNSAANGNWETAANWSDGVPTSAMAALIAAAGATDYTVTVGSSSAQADSLNVADSHATVAVGADNALTIAGALTVDAGKITLNGGTIQAGFIDLESGGTLQGWGTVSGPISNYGLIQAFSAHTLDISGNITGTGSLQIVNNTTVEIDGSVAATQTLSFAGGATGTLVLDHSSTFHGVLSGLVDSHQQVDLKDFTFTSGHMTAATPSFTNGHTTLVISNTFTEQSVTFTLAGNYLGATWNFVSDAGTGTIFYDPPATDPGAPNPTVADSGSTDVAQTVAALTNVDQFTFQDDAASGTLPSASTLVASNEDASATDAATVEATADTSSDDQSTAAATADGSAGTDPTSNLATNPLPATGDSTGNGTQVGATAQPASASTAPAGLAGGDTFVFAANFGNVTITNFHPETDVIEIDHTVFADFQALLAAAHDDGSGNAVISADPHDTITIKNVTVAQLVQHQGDFHFA